MVYTSLLLAALALPTSIFASPKVLALDFEKREVFNKNSPSLRRRGSANADIYNAQGSLLYLVNVTIGTPPQKFSLQLDTGSSDIWIPWTGAPACSNRNNRCATNGAFDPNKSSSFTVLESNSFSIAYVDGTEIDGDYFSDHFTIGGATVNDQIMGLAKTAVEQDSVSEFQGIVGVGFEEGEAVYSQTGQTYPNLLSKLVTAKAINARAYSLYLNDINASKGSILFGGVDTEKYSGDLISLPIQPDDRTGTIHSFTVALDNFNVIGADNKSQYSKGNLSLPVILDSGTTLTYLPDNIAKDLYTGVGAIESSTYGVVVPCDLQNSPAEFQFGFGNGNGPVIKGKLKQFVLPFPSDFPTPTFRSTGKKACRWGIQAAGSRPNLFGDTFLRSAYVVYDIDNSQVAIANANLNSTKTNVKEITNKSQIPGVSITASGAVAKNTATGIQGPDVASITKTASGDIGGVTGTFNLGTSNSKSAAARPAPGASIAVAVSAVVSMLMLLGGGMFLGRA